MQQNDTQAANQWNHTGGHVQASGEDVIVRHQRNGPHGADPQMLIQTIRTKIRLHSQCQAFSTLPVA